MSSRISVLPIISTPAHNLSSGIEDRIRLILAFLSLRSVVSCFSNVMVIGLLLAAYV